jgi:putative DNA primase/helicase
VNIPACMRAVARWIVYRLSSEQKKVPHDPRNPAGGSIDSTDERLWVGHDEATAVVEAGKADGLGFVTGDRWCYVDLDDCIDTEGKVSDFANDVVAHVNSYTEVSPSGTGLKIICLAEPARNHSREQAPGRAIAIKGHGGYTTITGHHLLGTATPRRNHPVVDQVPRRRAAGGPERSHHGSR